jgi:hypothetical protein
MTDVEIDFLFSSVGFCGVSPVEIGSVIEDFGFRRFVPAQILAQANY